MIETRNIFWLNVGVPNPRGFVVDYRVRQAGGPTSF